MADNRHSTSAGPGVSRNNCLSASVKCVLVLSAQEIYCINYRHLQLRRSAAKHYSVSYQLNSCIGVAKLNVASAKSDRHRWLHLVTPSTVTHVSVVQVCVLDLVDWFCFRLQVSVCTQSCTKHLVDDARTSYTTYIKLLFGGL